MAIAVQIGLGDERCISIAVQYGSRIGRIGLGERIMGPNSLSHSLSQSIDIPVRSYASANVGVEVGE
jgi:hypothetical protein